MEQPQPTKTRRSLWPVVVRLIVTILTAACTALGMGAAASGTSDPAPSGATAASGATAPSDATAPSTPAQESPRYVHL